MYRLDDLLHLMARLRDPEFGCPWDLQQSYATIVPHTLEEAYEVADAIEQGDFPQLREELGDLLFQVVYYSQLAREEDRFAFDEVVDGITRKLIRRHPHVFLDGDLYGKPDAAKLAEAAVKQRWEELKAEERAAKAKEPQQLSLLDDVPVALPALSRAAKLQKRAAQVGFDWPEALPVVDKVREELDEVSRRWQRVTRVPWARRLATCCSSWSTWPGISRSIRRLLCARPTASSSGDSGSSSGTCAKSAGKPKSVRWRNWTASGARLRKRRGARPAVNGKITVAAGLPRHLNQPKIQR